MDIASGSAAGRAPGSHHAGGGAGVGDACTVPVQQPVLQNQKKQLGRSRMQEPFTSAYYVTGMPICMQVLILRLRIFI